MNRADRMLSVLTDGDWHTRRELHEHGGYYLTNNAASELRARGLEVEQRKHQGNFEYRLLSEGRNPESGQTAAPVMAKTSQVHGIPPALAEQPSPLMASSPPSPAGAHRLLTTGPAFLPPPQLAGDAGQIPLWGEPAARLVVEGDNPGGQNGTGRVRSRPIEASNHDGVGGAHDGV